MPFKKPGRCFLSPHMIVTYPRIVGNEVSADFDTGRKQYTVRYKVSDKIPISQAGNCFFVAGLLPAMAAPLGNPPEPLTLEGLLKSRASLRSLAPVSAKLLDAAPRIQEIYLNWDRHLWVHTSPKRRRLRRVVVEAPTNLPEGFDGRLGAAAFFTAGVDSFYTALKHREEIQALVYVGGFEYFDRPRAFEKALEAVRKAAAALGKPLLLISTNLPSISGHFLPWGHYHGAALASAAVLLAGAFRRVFIPATNIWSNLVPLGSHPLVDPLWSTDSVEIVHDGCEADRIEKLSAIAEHEAVRSFLRVCPRQPDNGLNCSACEKCLRTMICLRMSGKLAWIRAFSPLDPATMTLAARPPASAWRLGWAKLLADVQGHESDPDLAKGIKRVLESSPF